MDAFYMGYLILVGINFIGFLIVTFFSDMLLLKKTDENYQLVVRFLNSHPILRFKLDWKTRIWKFVETLLLCLIPIIPFFLFVGTLVNLVRDQTALDRHVLKTYPKYTNTAIRLLDSTDIYPDFKAMRAKDTDSVKTIQALLMSLKTLQK